MAAPVERRGLIADALEGTCINYGPEAASLRLCHHFPGRAVGQNGAQSLFLATRHRPLPVFLGASFALTMQSVVAVAFGHLLSLLPSQPIHIVAGVLFVGCAVAMWRRTTVTEEEADSAAPRSFSPCLLRCSR